MADKASRRGAVDLGAVLMVAAFATIGAFMFWLWGQSEAELALRVVEDTTAVEQPVTDPNAAGARTITPADIQAGAGTFQGQTVRIANIGIASNLGRQGLWLDLPTGPFLVSLSPAMLADSVTFAPGSMVTVVGTMTAMSDSVSTSWLQAGRIGEGDQLAASFASHFIQASSIQPAQGGGGGSF